MFCAFSFSQVSGSVFEDLIESRSKLNVSNIVKVSFTVNLIDNRIQKLA